MLRKALRGEINNTNLQTDPLAKIEQALNQLGEDQLSAVDFFDLENTKKSIQKQNQKQYREWVPEEHAKIDTEKFYRKRLDENGQEIKDIVFFCTESGIEMMKNAFTLSVDATFRLIKPSEKSGYRQCLIISARNELLPREKQVVMPVVAILMRSKSAEEYRRGLLIASIWFSPLFKAKLSL